LKPSAGVDVGSLWLDLGFYPFAKPTRAHNSDKIPSFSLLSRKIV
jgi:hypothetical protein